MNPTHLSISYDYLPGKIDLSERLPKEADDDLYPSPMTLIDQDTKVILSIRIDEAGDRLISLDAMHVENKETNRAFHISVDAYLTQETITQLRNFLDLCAKFEATDDEEAEC